MDYVYKMMVDIKSQECTVIQISTYLFAILFAISILYRSSLVSLCKELSLSHSAWARVCNNFIFAAKIQIGSEQNSPADCGPKPNVWFSVLPFCIQIEVSSCFSVSTTGSMVPAALGRGNSDALSSSIMSITSSLLVN